jgi:tRNA(Ile2) C34 agmatinyltransferase TiaS
MPEERRGAVWRTSRSAARQMQTSSLQFARTVRKTRDVYEIVQKAKRARGNPNVIAVDADLGRVGAAACRPVTRS